MWPVVNNLSYYVDPDRNNRLYVTLNVTEKNLDVIEYYDNGARRPRWRRMCSRLDKEDRDDITGTCDKRITLREEGEHIINIQVVDEAGHVTGTENIVVTVVDD